MAIAIRASNLSKNYRFYPRPADRFLEIFLPGARHTLFPALHDVSFEVEPGETIGLVGQNGAGKSTLLKLLCGVTEATSGTLETSGSIASILELGAGFHPEFSGRYNAELNAAILGLSPAAIRERLPAMLEFSELGPFLERPVKTYSSGMYMRLAFSVAVNADPDILVIDEALAVGDGHFQKKCVDKIREFQSRGKTILFCSHALYYVSTLCSRTLWLDGGRLRQFGESVDVIHDYETFLLERDRKIAAEASPDPIARPYTAVRVTDVRIEDEAGSVQDRFAARADIRVRVRVEADDPTIPIQLVISVNRAADETQCFAIGTVSGELEPLQGRTAYEVVARLRRVPLLRGDYAISVQASDETGGHPYDRHDVRPAFTIEGDRFDIGLISVEHRWEFEKAAPDA